MRVLSNGLSVVFRPIEPEDQSGLNDFVKSLSLQSLHFRFLGIIKELPLRNTAKTLLYRL